ncbi:MAG: Stk1 family PASTA domain-containing Ser/Thr kinase [Coriobacteriia bacterium]|nr:Stk1 family PASTA domain-containing Ser/Thr kinase [Coriobacteriia bacterium]
MAENMNGRIFSGRYKLTERIGTGGMAEVYRADDTVLGRVVAVKVMLPAYASDAEFTERFRTEAASAANLQNPYIVNIYDWGQDNQDYFIVMEYVRGSDLKSGIQQRGALSQKKVAEIGMQVCQALSAAHNQDIIHRDIKPQNIMVQPDGNVKVMDFGIARAKNSTKTQTGSVLGTAHYISPEQAMGKDLTAASDIYSLGCVMYEAVTGQLPFDGPDAVSVATKQVNDKPVAPHTIRKDIDPDLESIIGMAMNKDPKSRFTTANDMQNALRDYLSGRPVNLGSSAAKTAVIGGVAGAAAGAAIGAAAASQPDKTGVMPAGAVKDNRSRQQKNYTKNSGKKTKNPSRKKKKIAIGVAIAAVIAIIVGIFIFNNGNQVPDVVGKQLDDAKTIITQEGFEVGKIDKVYNSEKPENEVISQDPGSFFKQPKGTKINLVVSLGAEMVTVPDVLGKSRSEAQDILEKAGFKVKLGDEQNSSKYEAGKVMSQDPEGNKQAPKDSTITIVISKGAESVNIPNVVGMSESAASHAIESAGFVCNINYDTSDTVDEGYVISQYPNSGNKADKGSTVTITVSKGSGAVTVPNVVGMSFEQAKSTLQAAGFNVSVSGSGNKVISQSPVSGNRAQKGSTVTITLGT